MFIQKYLQLAQKKYSGNEIDLNDKKLFDETEIALKNDCGVTLKRKKDPTANRTYLS